MSKASQDAYRKIRSGILSGHFPAGGFVTEDEFAQFCGLSRTPVREAIAELVSEMLLQRSDTNRVFVPVWSDEDEEELFTLRAMLESHCAARAARLISDDQIAALRTHCDFIDKAISQNGEPDVSGFVEGNRRFHAVILAAAQSERLGQLLRFVVSQIVVHRTAEQYSRADMQQSQRDHRDLVSAFAVRDEAWAGAIANTHIRRAANAYKTSRAS
ncbi:GntR family transcriptional regulator [Novosphingobium sp. MMS21-SN21R]|uniref:GntR family transcriptional regulator n=1 Tax=Novosphingobium sp. MMS21-SN21R TaxID=2969298 RepID=UPI00288811D0|nr:GntR family transcriptional regulator [Novosphingobium sp. MMS21-SN21R]MDT0506461.1 GntR family transcriptional regulator [Novosphingobium sp. MMS21-SN21R]